MNRHFAFNIIVLTCLSIIVGKSYGWNQPPVAVISGPVLVTAGETVTFYGNGSYDPDGGNIVIYYWYTSGGYADPDLKQSSDSYFSCKFRTGGGAYVYLKVKDDEGTWSTEARYTVYVIDMDADADRNGNITFADEYGEDTWAKGTNAKGAIVLPNCDDDDEDGAPDNWTGDLNPREYYDEDFAVWDWDLDGSRDDPSEYPNNEVDNDADIEDLAELWIYQLPTPRWGRRVTLKVENPNFNDQEGFFKQVHPQNIVRIFLPTDTTSEPGNRIVTAGDLAIIGPRPEIVSEVQFDSAQQPFIFEGQGIVKFRVEGIEFGAMVDITATFEARRTKDGPFYAEGSDKVRMRVAPFVMADHKMDVSIPAGDAKTVYVSKWEGAYPSGNEAVRNALREEYLVGHLDEVDDNQYKNDIWHQDPSEIGYVKAPYGSMPVFLVSPRAKRVWPEPPVPPIINKDLLKYIHRKRLEPNVGVCWRLEGIPENEYDTYDAGGNIESVLVASGPGKLLYGTEFHQTIDDFFRAQNVNPLLEISTSWLDVGHVDEIVSFAPDGYTIVADPEVCWGLLLWAKSVNSSATILVSRLLPPFGTELAYVSSILNDLGLRDFNLETHVMATGNLPGVRTDLNLASPVTITKGVSGNRHLTKAGAFIGFFGSNTREYWIVFSRWDTYEVYYRDKGTNDWYREENAYCRLSGFTGYAGYEDQDCIFKDAECFILDHWLQGSFQVGDYFTFEANPNCTTIEMPVLFHQIALGKAGAKTINYVNCLVDSTKVFTGLTGESTGTFTTYVQNLFQKGGFSQTIMADSRFYHQGTGDIHCGTNVQRVIPISYEWWEYP